MTNQDIEVTIFKLIGLLYVDNYLEGFHIPFVHKDLNSVLDYDNYQTEIFEGGVLQIGMANDDQPSFLHPEESPTLEKKSLLTIIGYTPD